MHCTEPGVLVGSQYFFFMPSEMIEKYYYHLLVCGHFYCQHEYSIDRKDREDPLLLCMLDGELYLEYEGKKYTARKGDIILLDCRPPHVYRSGIYCEFMFFHYSGVNSLDVTRHLIDTNNGPLFRPNNSKLIFDAINKIVVKLYNDQILRDTETSVAIYQSLCALFPQKDEYLAGNSLISNTVDYIKEHITESLTLDELAKYSNLSTYYFSHIFKEETGYSPIEFVYKQKINTAKTLLKTTNQTISEIAAYLNYSSTSSFINAFVLRVGISPSKFRKMPF